MTSRPHKTFKATALLLVICLFQVFVVGALAATPPQGDVQGRLTTSRNQPVTVNGNSSAEGQTILSGATIETPAGTGATISLGSLGSVDLAPGTKVELTFSNGQLKVLLIQGCVIVRASEGTYAEITNGQEKLTSNDAEKKQAMTLDVCTPAGGGTPVINQGAAASAGAGALGTVATVGTVGAASVGALPIVIGGIGVATLATLAYLLPCDRATNSSPSSPTSNQCS